ncbi:hypothetical protein CapIbe_014100 [Capra ibex]
MSSVRWDRSEPPDTVGALPQKALPPETPKIRRLLSKVPSTGIHWLRWYLLSTAPAILNRHTTTSHVQLLNKEMLNSHLDSILGNGDTLPLSQKVLLGSTDVGTKIVRN